MNKKQISFFAFSVFILAIVYFFPIISKSTNFAVLNSFSSIKGEDKPDTNVILIHISSSDIESLGDWPLKRSYYALLIDNLTKLNVKKIGLEIFLSENISSQSIYNDVLNKSIENSGKVVLASLAENIHYDGKSFNSSQIIYPSPKLNNASIATGHINFIDQEGILIPSNINSNKISESSFALKLVNSDDSDSNLKINIAASWQSFSNYTLLEFFELVESDSKILEKFKNKIILIGVSDPMIAKSIPTTFNSELPGLALHAFAIDNIINSRSINYEYFNLSTYLFIIFIFLSTFKFNKSFQYLSLFFISLILSYILWSLFILELNYAFLLIPTMILAFVAFGFKLVENKNELAKTKVESEVLKKDLINKEERLSQLKAELASESNNPSETLLSKIEELELEITRLKTEEIEDSEKYVSDSEAQNFEGIIYRSKKMAKIIELIRKVAPENAAVLVMGESGSGKELVANAMHNLSTRDSGKFVAVNCAALPDNLLESELFGHVKGAFTDAVKDKSGRFEEADNGTLFLDEIGETSENFQVKLLRVLQTGDFQKVGSSTTQHVDVRIVAATNKNLHKLVREKQFREDLYYRLNVINIELPKLKERTEDIEILAEHFAKREDLGLSFSKAVMKKLVEYEWKGNIRELESTIKRAAIFAKSDKRKIIKLKDLPENMAKYDKDELENLILESLREKEFSHSSINETAKELGGLNRTIVSENYRGIFFRFYAQNNFDLHKSISLVSCTKDNEVNEKVENKVKTYLTNIEKDLENHKNSSFSEIRSLFNSKYKNLPQKYHSYLDSIIQNMMKN